MPDPMPSANLNRTRRPPYDPPRYRPRRSRLLLVGLPVFAIFAAFASIVWLAYVDGAPGSAMGEPPLIKAEASPLKLPPEDPGGRVVADQGEVRELFRDEPIAQPELLLPRPEQPITGLAQVEPATPEQPALPGAASQPEAPAVGTSDAAAAAPSPVRETPAEPSVAGATQGAGQTGAPTASTQTVEDAEAALDALLAEVLESRGQPEEAAAPAPEVETAARAPEQPATPAEPEQPAQRTTDVRPAVAAPAPPQGEAAGTRPARAEREPEIAAIAPGEPVREQEPAPPTVLRPAPREAEQQAARVEPREVPVQPEPAGLGSTSPSYRIQLAAVREESDARRAWDLFQLDLGDVLRSTEPIIERADTANGVFYRVQVGPFANLAAAETVCDQLKQRNASCFVIRR